MARKLPNWIKAYLAYTNESESPEEYHRWVAFSVIAGALRRKVWFDMGYFHLRPNLYTVLVGPAGRCKKSTAMRIGRGLLGNMTGINFTTDSTSRERLIMDLGQSYVDGHSSMTAFSTEFASLLATSAMDMVVFLTDIYDSPDEWAHRTKTGGTNKIKAPYLNLIGATTPEWIAKAMPLDTIGIGLTSRIVFVYQDTPRVRPAFPVLSPEQVSLAHLLTADLAAITTLSGEYKFEPDAESKYDVWYQSRIERPNPTGDPRLNGYYERKPMHLIKLCMIIAASFRDELVITMEDYDLASTLLATVEEPMVKVFASVGKNPLSSDYDDVMAAILMSGREGISRGDLMKRFKHSVRQEELDEVLGMLAMTRMVMPGSNGMYYPSPELTDQSD